MDVAKLKLTAEGVESVPFQIPGATGGQFRIQILNEDRAKGLVTTIVHLPPGGRIPAHRHSAGAEMHFLLDGDLIEAGEALAPGAFLTHAAGAVHGPHESRGGARLLTVQEWQSQDGQFDFELAEEAGRPGGTTRSTASAALPPDPMAPAPPSKDRDAEAPSG